MFAPSADAATSPVPPSPPADEQPTVRRHSDRAAWFGSLLVHAGLIASLGAITLTPAVRQLDLNLSAAPDELPELLNQSAAEEFEASDGEVEAIGAMSLGGVGSALAAAPLLRDESTVSVESDFQADFGEQPALDMDRERFEGPQASTSLAMQGIGSVGATGAEGAIDRLTQEILNSLERQPTLVVWLFDESGSLRDERKAIRRRFHRIYDELGVIEAADNPAFKRHADKPLLTAVVGFGSEPRMLTPQPTDQLGEIEDAVASIDSGGPDSLEGQRDAWTQDEELYRQLSQENVFHAVTMVAEKFRRYRRPSLGGRQVLVVAFTDEAGDDANLVDDAVAVCRKSEIKVYVVGRPAPFGRRTAYVKWVDPDPAFDQRPQWAPVTLGPESLLPELLKLRFAGNRDEEELLDSTFGPYALTRLCHDTGGLYFTVHPNRTLGRGVTGAETDNLAAHFALFFDSDAMQRYEPEYGPSDAYLRLLQSNRARRALVEAAQISWTSPMQNVRLRFPKRDEAELAQQLSVAQRAAALVAPRINLICQTLLAGEADRDNVAEPRWRAGYDLALGRALAVKVRTDGYNLMLAEAKQQRPFANSRNNTWILRPAEEFDDDDLAELAAKSRGLLSTVVAEHPDTPWAYLAERELATPLGWQWKEGYTYFPPEVEQTGDGRPPRQPRAEPQGPPRRNPPPL